MWPTRPLSPRCLRAPSCALQRHTGLSRHVFRPEFPTDTADIDCAPPMTLHPADTEPSTENCTAVFPAECAPAYLSRGRTWLRPSPAGTCRSGAGAMRPYPAIRSPAGRTHKRANRAVGTTNAPRGPEAQDAGLRGPGLGYCALDCREGARANGCPLCVNAMISPERARRTRRSCGPIVVDDVFHLIHPLLRASTSARVLSREVQIFARNWGAGAHARAGRRSQLAPTKGGPGSRYAICQTFSTVWLPLGTRTRTMQRSGSPPETALALRCIIVMAEYSRPIAHRALSPTLLRAVACATEVVCESFERQRQVGRRAGQAAEAHTVALIMVLHVILRHTA
ncbi:hypothetical protein OH77DRAFT_257156 [Trametes cingulata]|nr:hypothetical protein OH77DRAFT_257156 [Trametes cingulata]